VTADEMSRAARRLRDHAKTLRTSYADPSGIWLGDPDAGYTARQAEADYDDHRLLATLLSRHARKLAEPT
jgi:hypothetical protein